MQIRNTVAAWSWAWSAASCNLNCVKLQVFSRVHEAVFVLFFWATVSDQGCPVERSPWWLSISFYSEPQFQIKGVWWRGVPGDSACHSILSHSFRSRVSGGEESLVTQHVILFWATVSDQGCRVERSSWWLSMSFYSEPQLSPYQESSGTESTRLSWSEPWTAVPLWLWTQIESTVVQRRYVAHVLTSPNLWVQLQPVYLSNGEGKSPSDEQEAQICLPFFFKRSSICLFCFRSIQINAILSLMLHAIKFFLLLFIRCLLCYDYLLIMVMHKYVTHISTTVQNISKKCVWWFEIVVLIFYLWNRKGVSCATRYCLALLVTDCGKVNY